VGEIVCSDVSPQRERSLTIIAENMELRLTDEALETVEPGKRTVMEHGGLALQSAQKAFLDAVRTGNDESVRARYGDAVRSLEVAIAANTSAQTGRIVSL